MAESIQPVAITHETRRRYLNYALSVITSRAIPDVRDGLKPVQRRILYTMYHDLRLHFDGRPAKSARIIGDVTGKYHPHAGEAAYEAMVRMAQNWVLRVPLVHPQGNFGSVDGDPPAAPRYTEARLTAVSDHLLAELHQNTVDVRANYDNTIEEPVVLPAQFPNLLVNGASGIAVGLATNIPPHNLREVINGAILLIDNPEATTAELLNKVKGPDFPLGGKIVTDRATLRRIYEEGSGSIKVQGEWKVENQGKKQYLVVTSIPYGVDKGKLEEVMGAIIGDKKLPQVLSLANESNEKEGLRIAMEIKAGSEPDVIMAYFYRHTPLQENFSYNLTCLVYGADNILRPERLGLKAMLRHFLDFRLTCVTRRFKFELQQLRRRIHILDGFRIVFDALDRAIKMIRESSGKPDAAEKLKAAFKLDDEQTTAILDSQLYKIAQMEIRKILDELRDKRKEADRIEALLASEKKLWAVIKDELTALAEKYGDRRRSRMATDEDVLEFDEEAYITKENTNVVLTRDGWLKRVGRLASVEGTRVREGDEVIAVVPGNTVHHVIFFTDDGTAYTMRMNEVPATSGHGEPIAKFFKMADQVKIVAAVPTDERFTPPEQPPTNGEAPGPYVLVVTAHGQVLRSPLAPFRVASTKAGRRYVRLSEGDRVVMATVPRDEKTIYLASKDGRVIHFSIEEINILSGVGKGVIGIKLADNDVCLGGALMGGRFDKFVLETSGGRTMEFGPAKYEVTSRGGKGHEAVKRTEFVRVVPPPIELVNWDAVDGGTSNGRSERTRDTEKNGEAGQTLFD